MDQTLSDNVVVTARGLGLQVAVPITDTLAVALDMYAERRSWPDWAPTLRNGVVGQVILHEVPFVHGSDSGYGDGNGDGDGDGYGNGDGGGYGDGYGYGYGYGNGNGYGYGFDYGYGGSFTESAFPIYRRVLITTLVEGIRSETREYIVV